MAERDCKTTERVSFPQISYKAFSYPGDEAALESVKKVPGFNKLFHWIIDNFLEEYIHLENLYNNVRVNERSFKSLHGLVREGCAVLDCPHPEVFIAYSPVFNASTAGVDRIYVKFNSYLIEDFSDEEQRFIIGHELGHIKAGHVLYSSVASFIIEFLPVLQTFIPFNIGLLYQPMLLALYEWYRRAEFTCDRAGLLYVQDVDVAMNAMSKLAGRTNKNMHEFDLEVMANQSNEVKESNKKLVKLMLFLGNMDRSHPYPAMRVTKLREWVASGDYDKALRGEYAKDELGEHELGHRMKCGKCGKLINSKLAFCPDCGTATKSGKPGEIGGACSNCGTALSPETKFCPKCGTPA